MDGMRLVDMAIGAVFGGGLASTWLQVRQQRRTEMIERRERYADLLIDLDGVLSLATSVRVAIAVNGAVEPEKAEQRNQVLTHHRVRVLPKLRRLAHTHPSSGVRDLAQELHDTVRRLMQAAVWHPGKDPVPTVEEVLDNEEYLKAERLLARLRDSI